MPMKFKLKYIIGILSLLGILVYLESIVPRPTNWTPTYSANDKIPFGTWVLRNSLEDLFPGSVVTNNNRSFYEQWREDSLTNSDLWVITNSFKPDQPDLDVLFRKAAGGSNILISSLYWPNELTDSLKIKIGSRHTNVLDSTTNLQTWNGRKWDNEYHFRKLIQTNWFELSGSCRGIPLGKENGKINFVKIPYGEGYFFLHTQPQVFTNYHLLYNDSHYLADLLKWIPGKHENLEWDEYYKPFRTENSSPLKMILSIPALKAAYWILILGLALYILTNIQRRQRPIPVLNPKTNLSLDFVQTIGLLYFNQKNHNDLLKKIYTVFTEHIRSNYFIRIELTTACYQKLALKSGVSEQIVNRIFTRYETLSAKDRVYEDELFQFNELIEIFYTESRKATSEHLNKAKQNTHGRKTLV